MVTVKIVARHQKKIMSDVLYVGPSLITVISDGCILHSIVDPSLFEIVLEASMENVGSGYGFLHSIVVTCTEWGNKKSSKPKDYCRWTKVPKQ